MFLCSYVLLFPFLSLLPPLFLLIFFVFPILLLIHYFFPISFPPSLPLLSFSLPSFPNFPPSPRVTLTFRCPQVVDIEAALVLFEQEIYREFEYHSDVPFFHQFEGEVSLVKLTLNIVFSFIMNDTKKIDHKRE